MRSVVPAEDWILENLRLDGQGLPGAVGLRLHASGIINRIRNVWITDCEAAGVIFQKDSNTCVLDGLVIEGCGDGIRMPRFLTWAEYCKDLILYDPFTGERRRLCNRHEVPEASYVACRPFAPLSRLNVGACCSCPRTEQEECCSRAPDIPGAGDLGCWAASFYRCDEFVSGPTPAAVKGAEWHVRHADKPKEVLDLREQPGSEGPGNSVTIVNCEIRNSTRNGIRASTTSNVRIVNCTVSGSLGHGLTVHGCAALRVEGCLFEDNGWETPAATNDAVEPGGGDARE